MDKRNFAFDRVNYILLAVGVAVVILGFILMSGSGSTVFGLFKNDTEGSTDANLRVLKDEFASMILLDDTFGEWKA